MGDSVTVEIGIQESDLDEMKADIEFTAITAVVKPYRFAWHPQFQVRGSELFPVIEDSWQFTVLSECETQQHPTLCIQRWEVRMTVDKICDVVSSYDLDLYVKDDLADDYIDTPVLYTVNIAQAAVCGIVIQEVPLTGE